MYCGAGFEGAAVGFGGRRLLDILSTVARAVGFGAVRRWTGDSLMVAAKAQRGWVQTGGGRSVLGLYVGNLRRFELNFDEFHLSILAVIAGFYSLSWLFVICYAVFAGMSLAWRAPISVQKSRRGARDGLRFG